MLVSGAVLLILPQPPTIEGDERPTHLERLWFHFTGTQPAKAPDVVYVPTPQPVVDRMLELAELKPDDVLYDLGCGDGRFVVTAARRYGVRAVGVDINPQRVVDSRRNAKRAGVESLVTIKQADIFELDISDATVVTLYLLPELNVRLMPKLARLQPGARILSFEFDMRGALPETVLEIPTTNRSDPYRVFRWIVPWQPEPVPPPASGPPSRGR
ncbi:MAG: class I SAM-dependent methyltransferase [Verrucomicrobia bacterium]|nr:class I SAM-dependent methyltransferase [Verrucomicrobiota bacterium]